MLNSVFKKKSMCLQIGNCSLPPDQYHVFIWRTIFDLAFAVEVCYKKACTKCVLIRDCNKTDEQIFTHVVIKFTNAILEK